MALNRYIYRYSAAHSHFLAPFFAILKNFRVPDITGEMTELCGALQVEVKGAFVSSGIAGTSKPLDTTGQGDFTTAFLASRSSPLYGKSQTNQPSALRLIAIIKH